MFKKFVLITVIFSLLIVSTVTHAQEISKSGTFVVPKFIDDVTLTEDRFADWHIVEKSTYDAVSNISEPVFVDNMNLYSITIKPNDAAYELTEKAAFSLRASDPETKGYWFIVDCMVPEFSELKSIVIKVKNKDYMSLYGASEINGEYEKLPLTSSHSVSGYDISLIRAKTPHATLTECIYGRLSGKRYRYFKVVVSADSADNTYVGDFSYSWGKEGELVETKEPEEEKPKIFDDLENGVWYYDHIANLHKRGLLQGSDGKVYPENNITREEICVLISRALNLQKDEDAYASLAEDSTVSNWAKEGVSAAIKAGIIKGDGSGKFGGASNATREQTFVMLARAFNIGPATKEFVYSDSSEISFWAKNAIFALSHNGYLKGDINGNVSPKKSITRAEFCAVLDRLL